MSDLEREPAPVKPYLTETVLVTALRFGNDQIQSQMWNHAPDALALDYTQTMMGLVLFQLRPRRIGMVGMGGGSLVKFCHRHLPHTTMEVVEINPQVVALREAFRVPADDERLRVHLADGADFIGRARGAFDVLLLDAYDRVGIPARLATRAYVEQCRRALRSPGLLVVNLACAHANAEQMQEHLQAVFPGHWLLVPDAAQCNDILFAWIGDLDDQHLSDRGRPVEIRSEPWDHVIPALDRVRFAWRERARAQTLAKAAL